MQRRQLAHPTLNPICWPDGQGIPLISGDGTVYSSSGHHGHMRAIRTTSENGTFTATVESTFRPGFAFLNGPSAAPGMLVAAPCWGPTYVFLADDGKPEAEEKGAEDNKP